MVHPIQVRIDAETYYQLPEYEQHSLIQLIDGEVVIGMAPKLKHQDIVRELIILFGLTARKTGGTAYNSPAEVYLDEHNVFEPDVVYLRPDTRCVREEGRMIGAPDLVVEVLSPSTAKYDREAKYKAYEQHGVDEYWIVDPAHELIEVWQQESGRFNLLGAFAAGDVFPSRPLGADVAVEGIFNN